MSSAARTTQHSYQYLLGDSPHEAQRLDRQAELWDPIAHALFDRVGIQTGWRVLEVGPGRGSVHMELRQRVRGPVDAVERSSVFAEAVAARSAGDGFGDGRIWCADLLDAALPENTYDLIFARWVFCFLPDVQANVQTLQRALKPGGMLAIQDYAHRESFALFPRPAEWLDFLAADRAFFASQGGDISIGGRLPAVFERAGLELVEATPIHRSGPPGSLVWDWLWEFYQSVSDRYSEIEPFDRAKAQRIYEHWNAAADDRRSFVVAPTMVDLVARKR